MQNRRAFHYAAAALALAALPLACDRPPTEPAVTVVGVFSLVHVDLQALPAPLSSLDAMGCEASETGVVEAVGGNLSLAETGQVTLLIAVRDACTDGQGERRVVERDAATFLGLYRVVDEEIELLAVGQSEPTYTGEFDGPLIRVEYHGSNLAFRRDD